MKINDYIKTFLIVTILYLIFAINYVLIRDSGIHIRQVAFFDYNHSLKSFILYYLITIPFITYILTKMFDNIFAMLVSTLLLLGVIPGIVAYSQSTLPSKMVFISLYVYVPFFLSILRRKKILLVPKTDKTAKIEFITMLNLVGFLGIFLYLFLWIKYYNIIHFTGFFHVYEQRKIFSEAVGGFEGYALLFAKSLSVFSLLALALIFRKTKYIFTICFIYLSDYGLGGHKSSIFMMIFIFIYYYFISRVNIKKYYLLFVVFGIFSYSLVLDLAIIEELSWHIYIYGIYERIFYVTSGLFARFFDYTSMFGFFHGSTGLLGKFLGGVDNGLPATMEIGSYYFQEGVRCNGNFIADGYLNFGIIGSISQLFILWGIFNKYDDKIFQNNIIIVFPFLFFYTTILMNIGVQTALLSYGMILFIIIFKISFSKKMLYFK